MPGHESVMPPWAQRGILWLMGALVIALGTAGWTGIRTSQANELKVEALTAEVAEQKKKADETGDNVIEVKNDVKHITRALIRIERKLDRRDGETE